MDASYRTANRRTCCVSVVCMSVATRCKRIRLLEKRKTSEPYLCTFSNKEPPVYDRGFLLVFTTGFATYSLMTDRIPVLSRYNVWLP